MMGSDNSQGAGAQSSTKPQWQEEEAQDEGVARQEGSREPIAVVGLACRFPGAPDAESFWRLLCHQEDLLREVPADRWDARAWYDADPGAPGRMNTRHGYFLDGVSGFDPLFFGISPREAAEMDPQQRMMLEVAWEALEDAGLPPASLKGSRTGVFMGSIWHDYADRHLRERAAVTLHSATGQSLNIVANRLSYVLGLKGPSLTVDTACSSSLVAVHLACQSLRSGESRLALVGGVNLMFSPEANVLLSKFGGLSPDGRSKAFAAGANGFGRGEGAGLVVLQPLSAALAAGARIYCVIRGSAVNNNGLGNGLTAPSVPGQAALLREAYARAGVPAQRVHYVETHGTGTALGDPTEASALGAALGEGRAIDRPLYIGSVKSHIGHLEGAAGIAGVIKVALALSHRLVPPHLLHGEPNPRIPFSELRLSLPRQLLPWPGEEGPATAGVSAFGWGGTNAHVVLEEAPLGGEELLVLAADSAEQLLAQAARAEESVQHREAPAGVRDLCRAWALAAGTGGHRAALSFGTRSELTAQLKSLRQGKRRAGLFTGEPGGPSPRVAFVCAPQGSEWPSMGRELLATEPVFRAALEALDKTFMPLAGWSLVETVREPSARMAEDEDAAEPLAFAVQVGLAALWRSWGVEPEVVLGHGVGEVAAACIAGGLEASDAVWKVYRACRLRQWEPLRDELEAALERLAARDAGPRWVSTVAREGERCRTLRQPVRFAQATERLVAEGVDVFVELSAHPVLCRPVEQLLRKAARPGVVVGSLRRDEPRAALCEALGALFARGVRIRWSALPPPESPVLGPSGEGGLIPWPLAPSGRAELLPLSAQTPEALARTAQLLLTRLRERPLSLHDVSYSAAAHRGHLHYRLALRARSLAEVHEGLGAFLRGELPPGLSTTRHADGRHQPVVFVFPGQGSQWAGMGRRLMAEEPVFRDALQQCDAALRRYVDWSLLTLLGSDAPGWMERVDQVQPAIFSIQVALARLWRSWGIVPDGVVGHSMGEVAAAHVAGALSLDDAARVICRRSLLLRRVSGQGGMAVVELSLEEARAAIAGLEDWLAVAVSNSPRSCVLSGEPHALGQVLDALEARQVFCRRVKVDVASHSPQMDVLREDLLRALEDLSPRKGDIPLYSTVTGQVLDGADMTPAYWVRNLRDPVLLSQVVEKLATAGHSLFVEVSPHPVLLPPIEQTIAHLGLEGTVLPSLRREQSEREVLLETLGALFAVGHEVEWKALFPEGGRRVRLPDYPWQRQECWFQPGVQDALPVGGASPSARGSAGASFLGPVRRSSLRPGAFLWEVELSVRQVPWLTDHRVQGTLVLPTTAYLDWVMTAVQVALGPGPWCLEELRIDEALTLVGDSARRMELLVDVGSTGAISFKVSSFVPAGGGGGPEMWTVHAHGRVRTPEDTGPTQASLAELEALRQRATEVLIGESHYQEMARRGLEYGPAFRGVREVWRAEGEAVGRLALPEVLGTVDPLHPSVLDAALQVVLQALPSDDTSFVPVGLRRFEVRRRGTPAWAQARLPPRESWRPGAVLEGEVVLLDAQGLELARVTGLELAALATSLGRVRAEQDRSLFEFAWRRAALPAGIEPGPSEVPWLVFQDASGVGGALCETLESWGLPCVRVEAGASLRRLSSRHYTVAPGSRDDLNTVLRQCFPEEGSCAGVVYLWGLDAPEPDVTGERALEAALRACGGALRAVQEVVKLGWRDPPRLWLVTRGATPVLGTPMTGALQAALWGLGRTVGHEHPELQCTCVDLDPSSALVDVEALGRELLARAEDEQVALRAGSRLAARLVRRSGTREPHQEPLLPVLGRAFQVETPPAGSFGGVVVRMAERRRPGPGEVEIAVEASALNFIDVMKTMGLYVMKDAKKGVPLEGLPLGLDCAGRVVAVGEGVTGLAVGDEVVAFTPSAMASHVVTDARFAVRRPASLSAEEACAIPSVFMTAWYALNDLGRLHEGERVLIHSAAGGLGLAAVQVAQALGAEVFATAGTPEKRELLRGLGIRHVMDSRTLAFADEVMRVTGGEGVDVVLNSLSGDAITRSMEVLAPDGRFLEVGNRDIHDGRALDLSQFRRRLVYAAIDLVGLREHRPKVCARLLREVMDLMASGELKPVRHQAFPVSRVSEAFREMAQGQHVGKLVVTLDDPKLRIVPPRPGFRVRADGTYLITGGLGGLGLSAARWLVRRGARSLLLLGRRAPSASVLAELDALRAEGARVEVERVDMADTTRLSEVVGRTHGELPRLRGVLHCAGVLDDGVLEQQEPARFREVLSPKVRGAWSLHTLTRDESLDFFVLYSSMSALLGMPGQGNYASANAAMDALAHHRRQQGLPALSVNWGPFSEVGLAAAQSNRGERLAYQGMASFTPQQGEALLERLLAEGAVHVGAVSLDLRQWLQFFPNAASQRVWEELAAERGGEGAKNKSALLVDLRRAAPPARAGLLENYLRERLCHVLRVDAGRVGRHDAFRGLGLDSLMSLELRNRIEAALDLKLSVTLLWAHSTLAALATYLLEQLGLGAPAERAAAPSSKKDKDKPRAKETRPPPAAPESRPLVDLSERKLLEMADDALAAWEDAS
ncbi:SDR family NAD(P)-dependent oxidoreductase [Melittangium boletus]|uniref:SDR family NAD(P)-dependent oxidoreductase n=1 Tax=Melittangium boletus TaxID=83453 RepID=UPI003DA3F1F9